MKYIIEDGPYSYQVDWGKMNKVEDGFVEEYHPDIQESVEAFLRLLENVHPREKIAEYIAGGIEYSGMKAEG